MSKTKFIPKEYKQLKDIIHPKLQSKKGTIWTNHEILPLYYKNNDKEKVSFLIFDTVESSPEWFEKITEEDKKIYEEFFCYKYYDKKGRRLTAKACYYPNIETLDIYGTFCSLEDNFSKKKGKEILKNVGKDRSENKFKITSFKIERDKSLKLFLKYLKRRYYIPAMKFFGSEEEDIFIKDRFISKWGLK